MPYAVPQWAQAGPAPGLRYAGFWIRFLAYLVDALIVDVPLVAIGFAVLGPAFHGVSCTTVNRPFGSSVECTGSVQPYVPLIWLVGLLLAGVYFVVLWSHFGQTLGQKLCGLRVVDAATGGRITTGRAIGRYLGFLISGWVLDIGLIWAAFDQRKQGWHDKMASTFVVRKA